MKGLVYNLQLKTRLKEILIRFIYRLPVHNITSDRKLYNQLIKISNSFETQIFF